MTNEPPSIFSFLKKKKPKTPFLSCSTFRYLIMLKHDETSRQDTQRPPTSLLQKSLAPAKSVYSFLPVCDASPTAPSQMSFKAIASSVALYFPTHGALLCQNRLALVMCFTAPFLQLLGRVNEGWNQLSHPGCPTKKE